MKIELIDIPLHTALCINRTSSGENYFFGVSKYM